MPANVTPGTVAIAVDGKIVANPVTILHFLNATVTPVGDGVVTVEFRPVIGPTGPTGPTGPEGPTGPQMVSVPWPGNLPNGTTVEVRDGAWVARGE